MVTVRLVRYFNRLRGQSLSMKNEDALTTYVSDMMALERLVGAVFASQSSDKDFKRCGGAAVAERLAATSSGHFDALAMELKRLGGHAAADLKTVVAETTGMFAAGLRKFKTTKVAKGLRDDYAAVALCVVSYGELLITARGLGDDAVADLAEKHMREYTKTERAINEVLPAVVLDELQTIGVDVRMSTLEDSRDTILGVWKDEPAEPLLR